ncbi:fibronectin type III domain-containing protein [bacterium]|nr:fibronectin type III domain-containing protein [bacterium]
MLLACSAACCQSLPPPTALKLTDDPDDDKGDKLLLSWKAPTETAPSGRALVGYRVFVQTGHEQAKVQELIPDAAASDTKLTDLKPWRKYQAGVTAVYAPAGVEFAPDEHAPDSLAEGVSESQMVLAGPVAPHGKWFKADQTNVLVTSLLIVAIVIATIVLARRRDMYIRPIAGLRAVDDAIGRATEMGRPILYVSGLTGVGDIATIAAMLILGHLAKRTAAYETPILVPCNDPLVMAVQREIVHEAYLEAGKPDAYDPDSIYYVTDSQFGYVAAVDGIMLREKPAANFFMGFFFAESLILAETGATTGAIQIAGTDADTQLPFFITSCDYTLMGEELYAAGAYLSRDPILLAQLKGQDLGKIAIFAMLLVGTLLVTVNANTIGEWFMKLVQVQ